MWKGVPRSGALLLFSPERWRSRSRPPDLPTVSATLARARPLESSFWEQSPYRRNLTPRGVTFIWPRLRCGTLRGLRRGRARRTATWGGRRPAVFLTGRPFLSADRARQWAAEILGVTSQTLGGGGAFADRPI